jgi:hypothetical protein
MTWVNSTRIPQMSQRPFVRPFHRGGEERAGGQRCSILQGNSLKDASFTSVKQLREHIDAFIEAYNENAKAFAWTKSKVHQKRLKARFADQ